MIKLQSKRVRTIRNIILIVILLISSIAVGYVTKYKFNKNPHASKAIKTVTNRPSEVKPEAEGFTWNGMPKDPKKIIIPTISVDNFIQNVDVTKNGEMATPGNINITGWYDRSSRPGQKGLSIIVGHVSGWTAKGAFYGLDKLKEGDIVTIVLGNDSKVRYKVVNINIVDTDKAAAYLFNSIPGVANELNLITCTGQYQDSIHMFNKRAIVQSVIVN